jgi:hypothetical protein
MRTRPPPATSGTQPLVPAWFGLVAPVPVNGVPDEDCRERRAAERVPLGTPATALRRRDRARVRLDAVRPLVERLDGELTPTPNSGGLAPVSPPEPVAPEVSRLAAGIGIWYCFPAGEPGSTCTPVGTGTWATAGVAATQAVTSTAPTAADARARIVWARYMTAGMPVALSLAPRRQRTGRIGSQRRHR